MNSEKQEVITLKVLCNDKEHELNTFRGEYRNLMMLIDDTLFLDGFGECRGMGRCGTCLVEIIESVNSLPALDRNESTTLRKTGINNAQIRLACQLFVDESLSNLTIRIVNP